MSVRGVFHARGRLKTALEKQVSHCTICPNSLCYWFHAQPQRCELGVARKYLNEMYKRSRPTVADQDFPCDAHIPSSILRDRPWDMTIGRPIHPSNWLDPFLEAEEETSASVGKREFPEEHSIRCEFCGSEILYKTRRPVYNVCEPCKLRIVKSRERGGIVDILSRPESVLETDGLVTPALPSARYGPSKEKSQVTRQQLTQMAPVDRRGTSGTRGTTASDESTVVFDGKKRVRAAVWLSGQMRRMQRRGE